MKNGYLAAYVSIFSLSCIVAGAVYPVAPFTWISVGPALLAALVLTRTKARVLLMATAAALLVFARFAAGSRNSIGEFTDGAYVALMMTIPVIIGVAALIGYLEYEETHPH